MYHNGALYDSAIGLCVNTFNLNFPSYGKYKITGRAYDINYGAIEQAIEFIVDDPCADVVLENAKLHDSINVLNRKIENLGKEIVTKNAKITIDSINIKILGDSLSNIKSDTITITLVFASDSTTGVTGNYKDTEITQLQINGEGNIVLPNGFDTEVVIWIFDITGKVTTFTNGFYYKPIINVSNLSKGVYFLWIHKDNKYIMYKFLKS